MWPTAPDCDRARLAVSLELDGELSQLDRAYLDAHVDHCTTCFAYRADLTATTSLIRQQPLEPTPQVTLVFERGPSRRQHVWRFATSGVALVLVGLLAATQFSRAPSSQSHLRADTRSAGSAKELRQIYSEFRLVGRDGTSSSPPNGRVV